MEKPFIVLVVLLIIFSSNLVINTAGQCTINITIEGGPEITVIESDTVLPVTFKRTGGSSAVTITATTDADSAKAGSDFNSTTKTITFGSSVNMVTENFTIVKSVNVENHIERFFINITTSDPTVCQPYDSVIINIKDDDKVMIGFHREFINVSENIGNVSMTFYKRIDPPTDITLTARYFTPGIGNATINIDYQNISKYITFAPLQYTREQAAAIAIIDNDIVEYTKCFNMSFDGATHPSVVFGSQSMICILNDDKVTIEFRYSNMSVEEELGIISVPVIKTGRSAIPVTVRMTMKEDYNTAIKVLDYINRDGATITFDKDVSEILFNVTIKNDDDFESTESFFIGIEALDTSTTTIGSKNVAVIRITDRIDNEINQERQRKIREDQNRRATQMSYLLYIIVAVLIIMIIIFIVLIIMIIRKLKKYKA